MTDQEKLDIVDAVAILVVFFVLLTISFAYFVGNNVINLLSGKALESWSSVDDDFRGAVTF